MKIIIIKLKYNLFMIIINVCIMNNLSKEYLSQACLTRKINNVGTKRVLTKRLFDYNQANQINLMFIDLETIGFPKKKKL